MAIDALLTTEKARAEIGELIDGCIVSALERDLIQNRIRFDYREDVWNMVWEFRGDSSFVLALEDLREAQREYGFGHEETAKRQRMVSLTRDATGISTYLHLYSRIMTAANDFFLEDFGFIQQHGTCVIEALMNAIEHGSNYCRDGNVTLQFLGGERGALFLVEDSGKGAVLHQMSPAELEVYYATAGITYLDGIKTYDDVRRGRILLRSPYSKVRGMGTPCFTVSENAFVGTERIEDKFRTIILYPLARSSR